MKKFFGLAIVVLLLVSVAGEISASNYWAWSWNSTVSSNLRYNPWRYWSNQSWNNTPTQPSQPSGAEPTEPTEPVQPVQPIQPDSSYRRGVPKPSSSLTSSERNIINMINRERTDRGLEPLKIDNNLVQVAKDKSYLMASTGRVEHGSRIKFHDNLTDAGVTFSRAGENIARANSIQRVHNGLMNSSGHRANILSSSYTHVGVGIIKYGVSYYATQVFIRK